MSQKKSKRGKVPVQFLRVSLGGPPPTPAVFDAIFAACDPRDREVAALRRRMKGRQRR